MTYREKFIQDHPNCTDVDIICTCPFQCKYEDITICPCHPRSEQLSMNCRECWNREIPIDDTTICPQELPCVDVWTWEMNPSPRHWTLVDSTTGVCSNCHRQDHIDPLAKYCRYCGMRLEIKE